LPDGRTTAQDGIEVLNSNERIPDETHAFSRWLRGVGVTHVRAAPDRQRERNPRHNLPPESIWGHHEWLPFYKIGWYAPESAHILWTQFALQTLFACVLFAVIANIPRRRKKKADKANQT
jgi:hypothetical protein